MCLIKKNTFVIVLLCLLFSCNNSDNGTKVNDYSADIDNSDNLDESISIKIGTQTWMKRNLDVSHYRNGDPIPQVKDPTQWDNIKTGAWCYYNNDPTNGEIYGKLYNWYAVNDSRGLAPEGWHIPSDAEWTRLTSYLGGTNVAGDELKEVGISHWKSPNLGVSNSSNFTALGAGNRNHNYQNGKMEFFNLKSKTWFWTIANANGSILLRELSYDKSSFSSCQYYKTNNSGLSVRCIKD